MTDGTSRIERWYSVSELAELSGFPASAIYAAIRNGRLKARSMNGGTRYRRVSESEWLRYVTEYDEPALDASPREGG